MGVVSERDELAQMITDHHSGNDVRPFPWDYELADYILTKFQHKPRTVTTAGELDALPVGSVVLDGSAPPCSFQKVLDDIWWAGSPYHHGKTSAVLARGTSGVAVLHRGGERG